jgi:hypothetical protein
MRILLGLDVGRPSFFCKSFQKNPNDNHL